MEDTSQYQSKVTIASIIIKGSQLTNQQAQAATFFLFLLFVFSFSFWSLREGQGRRNMHIYKFTIILIREMSRVDQLIMIILNKRHDTLRDNLSLELTQTEHYSDNISLSCCKEIEHKPSATVKVSKRLDNMESKVT